MIKHFLTSLVLCGALVGTSFSKDREDRDDSVTIISEGAYQGIKGILYEPFIKLLGSSKLTTVDELNQRLDAAKKALDKFSGIAQKEIEAGKAERETSKSGVSADDIKAIVASAVKEATKAQAAPAPVTMAPTVQPAPAPATATPVPAISPAPTTPSASAVTPAAPATPAATPAVTPTTPAPEATPLPGQLATPASK